MPTDHLGKRPTVGFLRGIGGGLAAAFVVGGVDALNSTLVDTLAWDLRRVIHLAALDGVCMVGLVVAPLAFLLALVGRRRWASLGAWWGLGLSVLAVAGERWFTRPPPHTEVHELRGDPWIYGTAVVVVLALGWLLARWDRGRGVWLAVTVGTGVLIATTSRSLPHPGPAAPGAPDVILVTIDTLRADHVGVYGNRTIWTPTLDALAEAGAIFQTASAQIAVTGPSHLTMLSGQGPWQHQVLLNGMSVPERVGWLPESLRAAGYRTGAFVSAYVLDGSHGFARGFEVYDDDFGSLPGWGDTAPGRIQALIDRHRDPTHVLERTGAATVDRALEWRQSVEEGPVFMWVHLFEPHGPYTPPPPWDTAYYSGNPRDPLHTSMAEVRGVPDYLLPSLEGITDTAWVRAQYAGEVSVADQAVERLLQGLRGAEESVVIVAGDHGENLGEGGVWYHHGGDLQTSELAVPLLIRYPAKVPAGSVVRGPVELTDLSATIAELVGMPTPAGGDGWSLVQATVTGTSPRPWARGLCRDRPANQAARAAGSSDHEVYLVGTVRSPGLRLISRDAPGGGLERWEWRGGVEVSVPMAGLGDGLTPDVQAMLDQVQALVRSAPAQEVQRDASTLEKLEALGYVE